MPTTNLHSAADHRRAARRRTLAMPLEQDRSVIRFDLGASSLGLVLAARSERGICAILLGDDANALQQDLQRRFATARLLHTPADPACAIFRIVRCIEQAGDDCGMPLDLGGTPFQRRVWLALRDVPCGATASYGEIARRIGAPKASRAVAAACAANALAVLIPCHRVIAGDGRLSGYRWGAGRKRLLLEREAAAA
jgi:AraC family transcriptional regulator of adaptative response/methylated-DNA-[protein]-cysteine methyltransferase